MVKPPLESKEQTALIGWCMRHYLEHEGLEKIFAIPNGGKRDKREAARMKAEGLRPGVPDLCLPVARGGYHSLYIEMKRRVGGQLGDSQKIWRLALQEEGHRVEVCKGFAEARKVILDYYSWERE